MARRVDGAQRHPLSSRPVVVSQKDRYELIMVEGKLPIIPVSSSLCAKLRQMFAQNEIADTQALLESRCGASIAGYKMAGAERIRCAAVKLSDGSLQKLDLAISGAEKDFRDILVAAGFSDSRQHLTWLESPEG
jgi:hypothetical protein